MLFFVASCFLHRCILNKRTMQALLQASASCKLPTCSIIVNESISRGTGIFTKWHTPSSVRTFAFFFTSTSDHIKKKGTINSVENAGRIILIQSELPVSWIRKLNKTSIAFTAYLVENMLWSPKKFVWPHYACGIIITRSFEKKRANTEMMRAGES